MSVDASLVIVGAGTAGAELAFSARQLGWSGPITLLGAEPYLPYHRPPLSKSYLLGTQSAEKLLLRPAKAYETAKIELVTGREVLAIDRAERRLHIANASPLAYDKLALCLGGRPRLLNIPGLAGAAPDNVLVLRDQHHADVLRERITQKARVVVIGGGYIGLEVAASARQLEAHVTVLEAQPRVLARVAGAQISAFFEGEHRAHGVDVRTGVRELRVQRDASDRSVVAVEVDGETLPVDVVVVGVGMLANTELAAAAGLEVRAGIVVDEHARTSDPDIYAAGDCTEFPGGRLYPRPIRLESVPNATEQARTAAAALCGKPRPYHPVPWFWSDQYDLKFQNVGLAQGYDRFVLRGDPATRAFTGFYLAGEKVLAVDTINRPGEFMVAKRLVSEERSFPVELLADESQPLKALLGA